ncbi:MAG: D-alanine--D-alanine ligase [Candidatus Paceibacterota bacterium]|jgi:D-alanine-D-alanine ligase
MKKKTGGKIRVGVLFGGKSAEHEVSLQSAQNIIKALDRTKYDVVPIGIDKHGKWLLHDPLNYLLNAADPKLIKLNSSSRSVALAPESAGKITALSTQEPMGSIDVVFPVLHGPFGEDGSIQGLLKVANVPFVGAGVLGSAVGMDKDVMKRLLRDAGIPIGKFITVAGYEKITFAQAKKKLGTPLFIKPANMGSSVGVSKVKNEKEFKSALAEAFKYDTKVLIEEMIVGREIECSVLGNEHPMASVPGEVIPHQDFYSYDAKYIDPDGAGLEVPAKLPKNIVKKVQDVAIKTFKALNCEGLGRVDMFLKKNGQIFVNEINTIPGFTKISMYPKLWEASGMPQPKLLDNLIKLGIERFERDQKLQTEK